MEKQKEEWCVENLRLDTEGPSRWSMRKDDLVTPGLNYSNYFWTSHICSWIESQLKHWSLGKLFHSLTTLLEKKCSRCAHLLAICPEILLLCPLIPCAGPDCDNELHSVGDLTQFTLLKPFLILKSWSHPLFSCPQA